MRAVNAHNEHMFCEPVAVAVGLLDSQTQGEFFETDGVAGVLGIDAIDHFVFEVDIDAAFFPVFGDAVVEFAFAVEETEECRRIADFFKLFVARPIEH